MVEYYRRRCHHIALGTERQWRPANTGSYVDVLLIEIFEKKKPAKWILDWQMKWDVGLEWDVARTDTWNKGGWVNSVSVATSSGPLRYNDVIMSVIASQITGLTIVYSTVYSRHESKKTSKLRVTRSLAFAGNSTVTGEFPAQRASNT